MKKKIINNNNKKKNCMDKRKKEFLLLIKIRFESLRLLIIDYDHFFFESIYNIHNN